VTTVVAALAGGVLAFVTTLLLARFVFFVGGLFVGAVVGSRLFVLADPDAGTRHGNALLALVFVPAVAMLCGFLAHHLGARFLTWGTALAGSALMLSGLGRLGSETDDLWRPTTGVGSVVVAALWLGLAALGHRAQRDGLRRAPSGGSVDQPSGR
jgi:hypothetical protein